MTENRENWLYSDASGLYFQHDGFVMRASDGKQYDIEEECELLNKYDIENRELKLDNKQFKKQLKIYEKFLEYSDLDFDWTEFCTADECINEYKNCIDDEIDCKDCVYLEDIND